MIDTTYYLTSISVLSAIILAFVGYYLYEGHKKTDLKNENTKLQETIMALQTEKINLDTKNTELEKQVFEHHKQDPHSTVINMYKTKDE